MRCIHVFLAGGKQWCKKIPEIIDNVDCIGIHKYVCSENDLVDAPQDSIVIDNRINSFKKGRIHNLDLFEEYSSQADYLFIYNNILSSIDRARLSANVLKKMVWISFGSDLNCERESGWHGSRLLSKIYNSTILPFIEMKSRFNMSRIVAIGIYSIVDGFSIRRDYDNVPILPFAFAYDSNDGKQLNQDIDKKKQFIGTRIMVGHHGYPGVNHIGILEQLSKYKNENIRVFLPLVYGDEKYIEKVQKRAVEIFGDKIEILRERVALKEYQKYLETVDIAVFDTEKYIAVGNINLLLLYGVKLYTKMNGKIAEQLRLNNIETFDSSTIGDISFSDFSKKNSEKNIKNMYKYGKGVLVNDNTIIAENAKTRINIMLNYLYSK